MTDSAQSRDDAARTTGATDEVATEAKARDLCNWMLEGAAAASPEQTASSRQSAIRSRAAEDKAAEAAARAAERAAEKRAAQEEANTFPYGVTVGQVYDGPLDLLLDLIRKQDIDIYDIPIAKITGQFLAYIENLKQSDIDGAGEFIYMASLLIHIKSKMLLPRKDDGTTDAADEDPRRELVERLLEHQRFKNAAQMLLQKQMLEESSWTNPAIRDFLEDEGAEPEIAADTVDLVRVFREILERARQRPVLNVDEETVTVGANDRLCAASAGDGGSSSWLAAVVAACTVGTGTDLHLSRAAGAGAAAGDPVAPDRQLRRNLRQEARQF